MNKTCIIIALFCWLGIGPATAYHAAEKLQLSFITRNARDHSLLSNVVCRVFSEKGVLYTYAISNHEGKLTVSLHDDKDVIEFSYVGFGTVRKAASTYSKTQLNVVELTEKSEVLKEIVIKSAPITARNDTISYHVSAFQKQGDVHLEDILKKLPGIKVAENGAVSYQGKAINKFYIEGKDLLGNSYAQATKNMPVDAIATIEVLENHQPIKMLRGRQFSEHPALNIKIKKKNQWKPFGEVEGGVGVDGNRWNNRLFLTQIFQKNQFLLSAKMNNVGVNLADETKEHIHLSDLYAYEALPRPALSTTENLEALPAERYIQNKAYVAGVNALTQLSKEATLRVNVLLNKDHTHHSHYTHYLYGGDHPVELHEASGYENKMTSIQPIVKYELNSSKTFIADELKFLIQRNTANRVLTNNNIPVTEDIKNRPTYLQNSLNATFSIGQQLIQTKSFIRYFQRDEDLYTASDSSSLYRVEEQLATRSFMAKHSLASSFPLWGNTLLLDVQMYYRDNAYDYAQLSQTNRKFRMGLSPKYAIRWGGRNFTSVELPVEWLSVSLRISSIGGRKDRKIFLISPKIYTEYHLSHYWRVHLSASVGAEDVLLPFYTSQTYRTSYRNEYIPHQEVYVDWSRMGTIGVNYKNLATMFFANVLLSYSKNKREYYTHYQYSDSLTTVTLRAEDNDYKHLLFHASVDKSFTEAGLSVKSEVQYSRTSYLMAQSLLSFYNTSHIIGANVELLYQKLHWLKFTMGVNGMLHWEKNELYTSDRLKTLILHPSLSLFPTAALGIHTKYYHHVNEISRSQYRTCGLWDVEASYKVSKLWEIGLSVTNLLNTTSYDLTQNNGLNTFTSSTPIRGRECLVKVLWRI